MPINNPEEAVQALFRAINDQDIETLLGLYEPGAIMVAQPGHVASGTAALREALNGYLALKPTLTLEKNELITGSDLALSLAKWMLKGTGPDGASLQMEGTATDILRKQADGSWLFVIDNPWGGGILG